MLIHLPAPDIVIAVYEPHIPVTMSVALLPCPFISIADLIYALAKTVASTIFLIPFINFRHTKWFMKQKLNVPTP
jgi:hypothetical protein